MSIIEQATRRLEELKRAGVEVAWEPATAPARSSTPHLPEQEQGYSLDLEDDAAFRPLGASVPSSNARGRAAGSAAAHASSSSLVRVGLRESPGVELDLMHLAELGYLVPGAARTALVDEFRGIKQPLLKNARAQAEGQAGRSVPDGAANHANLIMVTSALAGEGKTFCAVNLALSIASEVDASVLLVDADVLRPSVMARLGVQGHHKGLLDLLSDTTLELPALILKTNIAKLSLLPAGAPTSHSTELLGSDALRELLHEIATRYPERIVIFDSPPLLSTTESRVLAARMGQIVMVVSAGATQSLDLAQAYTALEHCAIVLSVLNKSVANSEQRHYGSYSA